MSHSCPCHPDHSYETCCGPYLSGEAVPPTPEALMRSRYTAYTRGDIDYLGATQGGPANEGFDPDDTRQWAKRVVWEGLQVMETSVDGDNGIVLFQAHYSEAKKPYTLTEKSVFRRVDGRWMYWDSLPLSKNTPVNMGLNAPCACGSGKKYKRCCAKA